MGWFVCVCVCECECACVCVCVCVFISHIFLHLLQPMIAAVAILDSFATCTTPNCMFCVHRLPQTVYIIVRVRARSRAFARIECERTRLNARELRARSRAFVRVHSRSRAFARVRARSRAFARVGARWRALARVGARWRALQVYVNDSNTD